MRLGLSSAAAPDLSLEGLLEGCLQRGLSALELQTEDAHGVGALFTPAESEWLVRRAAEAGVEVVALSCRDPHAACATETLRLGARLGVPLLVPVPVEGLPAAVLTELVKGAAEAGGRLLLLHGTDPEVAARLRRVVEALPAGAVGLAWEVDPHADDPARVPGVLEAAGPLLEYVRLRGGGPETAAQTGMGVGALMARLALARFAGPLVLTPTTPAYRHAWRSWLGRSTAGTGCGSKQSDASLVTLPLAAGGGTRSKGAA